MLKKILIVLTGGTIGSFCRENVRGVSENSPYILIDSFRKMHPEYSYREFEFVSPYSILSENLNCARWDTLYSVLVKVNPSEYAGVVVTHGSDTLAYTAAALGMLMRHTEIPIVLTASDRPVSDPKSNAIANFRASVDFILNGGTNGVFVSYKQYAHDIQAIYLATRLCSADNLSDEFSSYGGGFFGQVKDGNFIAENFQINPPLRQIRRKFTPIAGSEIQLRKKIMLLRSYPGMDYSAINPDGFTAVINYGYHSATACTEGDELSLLQFSARCQKCGAKLWLGAFKRTEDQLYSTSRELLDQGILQFFDMSPEAAYVKAVLAYNLPEICPEEFMNRCVYFEMAGHNVDFLTEEQNNG